MKAASKSSGFAVIPYGLMDQCHDYKVWAVYATLHRHGWNSSQGCFASLTTLSNETGISRKVVQRSLSQLVESGWITVEHRYGMTAVYHVRIDKQMPKRPRSKTTQVENDPGQKRPRGQVKNDLGTQVENDLLTRTQEQEPINKNPLVKLQTGFAAAFDSSSTGFETAVECPDMAEPALPGLEPVTVTAQPVAASHRKPRAKGSDDFERFWRLYLSAPIRATSQSKPKALAQWQKTIRSEPVDTLIKALESEIAHQQAAGDQFVSPLPDCFRWLRDERYATVDERPAGAQQINHDTYVF